MIRESERSGGLGAGRAGGLALDVEVKRAIWIGQGWQTSADFGMTNIFLLSHLNSL